MALEAPPRPEIAEFLKQNGAKAAPTNQLSPYGNYPYAGNQPGPQGPGGAARRPLIQIDPNEIQKKVKEFEGLAAAIKTVDDKSDGEQRGWIQRRTDNRTVLYAAEEQQFADELAFVKPIAVEEKAAKTAKAIDDLTAKRKKRADLVSEQLREQRRTTLRRTGRRRGDAAVAVGGGASRGPVALDRAATARAAPMPERVPIAARRPEAWRTSRRLIRIRRLRSKPGSCAKPEDKRALLQAVSDLDLSELQTLDELATKEQAMKTSAAILCLMMLREQRVEKITVAWQEDDARLQKLQSMPGRGGMQGNQQQQGQHYRVLAGGSANRSSSS